VAAVLVGVLLSLLGPPLGFGGAAGRYRGFLVLGGWILLPCWGAALGAAYAAQRAARGRERVVALVLALVLAALPVAFHPVVPAEPPARMPATTEAKVRAIRRWSFESADGVQRIVALSRDPDVEVRQQAALALGENLVVADLEADSVAHGSRFAHDPLRDSIRTRLAELTAADPVEAIRIEAAHALWRSPRAFGRVAPAAETLAAVLDRARGGESPSRSLALALEAAAVEPDSSLKQAARRLAARATDPELRKLATEAAAWR
jgi:hypothetical protein